jgi:hypothetical protein
MAYVVCQGTSRGIPYIEAATIHGHVAFLVPLRVMCESVKSIMDAIGIHETCGETEHHGAVVGVRAGLETEVVTGEHVRDPGKCSAFFKFYGRTQGISHK